MPDQRKHAASDDAPALAARKKRKGSNVSDSQSSSPLNESGKRAANIDSTKSTSQPGQETQSSGSGVCVSKEPSKASDGVSGEKAVAVLFELHEAIMDSSCFHRAESLRFCKHLGYGEMVDYDEDDYDDDGVAHVALKKLETVRQGFLDAKHQGIHKLVDAVMVRAYYENWFAKLGDKIQEEIDIYLFEIFLTTPDIVLEHLLIGDIASASLENEKLRKALTLAETKDDDRPAICLQYLTDQSGLSPTVGQLRQMMNTMELYCEPDHANNHEKLLLVQIENEFGSMKSGSRKCLCDKNGDFVGERSSKIREWTQATRNLLERLEDDYVPASSLCKVEYTRHPEKRLNAHAEHDESNYIMSLSEAVCQVLFPERSFHINQFSLYRLHRLEHAVVAEILFSRLAYISHGGGFNHQVAGLSEASAVEIPAASWSVWCEEVFTNGECLGRIKEVGERLIRIRQDDKSFERYAKDYEGILKLEDQLSLQLQAFGVEAEQQEKLAAERIGEADDQAAVVRN